jgi:hypothetical protein
MDVKPVQEAAQEVLRRCADWGLVVRPSSRFDAMCRVLGVPGLKTVLTSDPAFMAAVQGLRDVNHLQFAFRHLDPLVHGQGITSRMQDALDDSVLGSSGDQSPGRDAQAELFFGAVLARAGLHPKRTDAGDWLLRRGRFDYTAEVKRVKTAPMIQNRFSDACKQIGRSGLPGLVSIDVSLVLQAGTPVFDGSTPGGRFEREHARCMKAMAARYTQRFAVWRRDREVLGAVLLSHQIKYDRDDRQWYVDLFVAHLNLERPESPRVGESERLLHAVELGMPVKVVRWSS